MHSIEIMTEFIQLLGIDMTEMKATYDEENDQLRFECTVVSDYDTLLHIITAKLSEDKKSLDICDWLGEEKGFQLIGNEYHCYQLVGNHTLAHMEVQDSSLQVSTARVSQVFDETTLVESTKRLAYFQNIDEVLEKQGTLENCQVSFDEYSYDVSEDYTLMDGTLGIPMHLNTRQK